MICWSNQLICWSVVLSFSLLCYVASLAAGPMGKSMEALYLDNSIVTKLAKAFPGERSSAFGFHNSSSFSIAAWELPVSLKERILFSRTFLLEYHS